MDYRKLRDFWDPADARIRSSSASEPRDDRAAYDRTARGFVLAASLTLLPALLARLGPRIDRFALPRAGAVQYRSEALRAGCG